MKFLHPLNRLIFIVFCLIISATIGARSSSLVINEVMASNIDTKSDEDGDYEDWIELYNNGNEVVNLEGWGLSDDYDRPFRWVLPAIELFPGEFLLIWASNKDRDHSAGELHTNFAISSSGEEVILTMPDGERVDEVEPRPIPRDMSWGRYPDGSDDWYYFENASPGTSNLDPSYRGLLDPPTFSHQAGFYSEPFLLEINHPDPNVSIYYTLDGSTPTQDAQLYTGPIEIYDRSVQENVYSMIPTTGLPAQHTSAWRPPAGLIKKGTPLRILLLADEFYPLNYHASYFVFPNGFNEFSLPIFSMVTDPKYLFSDSFGIYVPGIQYDGIDDRTGNYSQRGREWERKVHLSFFENNELKISQNVGIRIHGGWSRRFAQKSLRVYARSNYGSSHLNTSFFGDEYDDQFKRILLRNSGNDWNLSLVRDGTIQKIWNHVGMEGQRFSPSLAFINGEYWGIHNIRERLDKHYLYRKFGIEEDEIDILTRNMVVLEGDSLHYQHMLNFIEENDLTSNDILEQVSKMIDLDNFMSYYALQCYCANTDWPHNNIDYWRKRVEYVVDVPNGHDGRWRWLVYDLDRCLGYSTNVNTNMITWITSPTGNNRGAWATFLIRSLLENESFKYLFINRMADHLNSTFKEHRVQNYINMTSGKIAGEISEHIHRWINPNSITSWNTQLNRMRNFAQQRPNVMRNHLRSYFQISSNINIAMDVNNEEYGYVGINSLTIGADLPGLNPSSPYPWTGIYFHDIPVELKAQPTSGHQFDYWTMAGDTIFEQSITMAFQSNVEIVAHFSIDSTYFFFPEPYVVNECTYVFDFWSEDADVGNYPENMAFVYMSENDPTLDAEIEGFTEGVYFLDNRTRINGLGEDGFSFINTGNEDGNPGYPGVRLGGALLGISTLDTEDLYVKWEGGTLTPNSRVYHIRLQYRIGDDGVFNDLTNNDGTVVEYVRSDVAGHSEIIGPIALPAELMDVPYVQLFWRYYYTGERLDEGSGARDQLRIGQIVIGKDSFALEELNAEQFRPEIDFSLNHVCLNKTAVGGVNIYSISGAEPLLLVSDGRIDTLVDEQILEFAMGNHEYELVDIFGCIAYGEFEILFSDSISINWEAEMPVCAGESNGTLTAEISGGTSPITYEWSTGEVSAEFGRYVLWDFNGLVPSDSPETTEGMGEAVLIGGVNNPESGTVGNGSSDPANDNQAWQTTGYPSQSMNPRTAGVQFNVSTEGYQNIKFRFDQRLSNTAANTWVVLYTADRTADPVIWNEGAIFRVEPQLTGTGDTWYNRRGVDLSEFGALNENPNVAFRIVSDFDPESGQYEAARLDRDYGGGTSRWDMVEVYGDPLNRTAVISDLSAGEYWLTVTDALSCIWEQSFVLEEPDSVPVPVVTGLTEVDGGQMTNYSFVPDNIEDFEIDIEVENAQLVIPSPADIIIQWDEVPAGEVVEGLIRITLTNERGCSSTYEITVLIFGPTSTDDLYETMEVSIYPNPNRGEFEISLSESAVRKIRQIEIYSSTGKLIRQISISGNNKMRVSMDGLSAGYFQVVLRDADGEISGVQSIFILE